MFQSNKDWEIWRCKPPQRPGERMGKAPASGDALKGAARIKVLVVDDEPTIADTVVEILNEEGLEAIAASSGEGALAALDEFAPDVLLTDVVMPGMNGVELGIEIRKALPKCRILLFSGQSATVDLLKEARARGYEFEIVAKPIKPQGLVTLIRQGRGM